MEDLAGEKVKEQLTFENLVPEEKETPEIIPTRADGLQPRKLEDVIPDANILLDTYIIYPDGGYHPFYGVPDTFPIYQQKIWPYVKRIKFSERWKSKEVMNKIRKCNVRKNQSLEQLNPYWDGNYFMTGITLTTRHLRNEYTVIRQNGKHCTPLKNVTKPMTTHRLNALAFIPNPDPEKNTLVLHRNGDPTNFLLKNLKWGDHTENSKDRVVRRRPDTMEQKYLNLVDQGLIKG